MSEDVKPDPVSLNLASDLASPVMLKLVDELVPEDIGLTLGENEALTTGTLTSLEAVKSLA
jgi:hypothetical protein